MCNSVTFSDQTMNVTIQVKQETLFVCDCGWFGFVNELVTVNDFSACPQCNNLDVRVDLGTL